MEVSRIVTIEVDIQQCANYFSTLSMVVQLPPEHDTPPAPAEVEAGVIDDARARHRRERWAGAILAAIAIVAGLIFAFGGGGGAGAGKRGHGGGLPSGAAAQPARPVAIITRAPSVTQFGLAAPGVGWVANDTSFWVTRDGGRKWDELNSSRATRSGYRQRSTPPFYAVPGSGADISATSAPSTGVLALAFMSRLEPLSPFCAAHVPHTEGAVYVSDDAGVTWTMHLFPGCNEATSLSFINARMGFVVFSLSARSSSLYRTDDGGARWVHVDDFSAPMTISFGSRADGLALVTPNNASGAGVLYATADGGHKWQRSHVCGASADPTYTVYCGAPTSFGRHGIVLGVAQNLAKRSSDRAFVYSTADAGRHWIRRDGPPLDSPEMPAFSAPNAEDLFIYSLNGVLHTSTDGGRTWSTLHEPQFKDLSEMQFVNADYGWILAAGHFDYTVDGGRSWRPFG